MYALQCGDYEDVISWTNNGISFVITDARAFTKRVLPALFKLGQFESFQRKLARWGFVKRRGVRGSGTDPFFWWFRHPYFQRGSIDLCHRLTCSDHAFNKNLLSLLPTSNAVPAGENQHTESMTNVSGPAVPSWIGNDALHLCQGSSEVTMLIDCYHLRVMLENSTMRRRVMKPMYCNDCYTD